MYRKNIALLFLLISFKSYAVDLVICDQCTEQQMIQKATKNIGMSGAVIVVNRENDMFHKYTGTTEVMPDESFTLVTKSRLTAQEESSIKAGLRFYHALKEIGAVGFGQLGITNSIAGMGGSILNFVGNPSALGTLSNAVSSYATHSAEASSGQALDMLGSKVADNLAASMTVIFDDGSRLDFDFQSMKMPAMRAVYRFDPQSARLANGESVPMSRNDARWLQVSGSGPFLELYASALERLGMPVMGQQQCIVTGIKCDGQGCIFVYDCP